jgi:hypothetical protein
VSWQKRFSTALALVNISVLKEIKKALSNHDPTICQEAKQRKSDLSAWKRKKNQLAYSSLIYLCQVIKPGATRLPGSSEGHIVLKKFLEDLVDRGFHTTSSNKNAAPYIKDGAFQSVLPVAVESIKKIYGVDESKSKGAIVEALCRAWHCLQINHIPGTPPCNPNALGRPSTLVAFNCWTCFGAVNVETRSLINLRPEEQLMDEMESNLQDAMETDADGPWYALDYAMKDFDKMLKRRTRPLDLQKVDLTAYSVDSYVTETYRYVRDTFDMERPLHQLALIIGIVFASLAPDLFTGKPGNIEQGHMDTPEKTQRYLNTLPWETRSKGGLKEKPIIMSMAITYIIAFYDPRSPFSKHMKNSTILGEDWTSKHSKLIQTNMSDQTYISVRCRCKGNCATEYGSNGSHERKRKEDVLLSSLQNGLSSAY